MSGRLSIRLSRLLNMVPYFVANPGISAAEAAAELGVSTKQLMSDLNQLWMCGLPGYGPGDLINLSFSEESIEVTFSAGIDRPLRLTSTEATALLVALRSIADLPGMVEPTAAHSAMAKIEAAIVGDRTGPQTPYLVAPVEAPAVTEVRSALADGRALRLVYYSASRDVVSERVVDPIRIVLVDNNSYLQAWCRQAEGVRLFRFDRIEEATELDEPTRAPSHVSAVEGLDLFSDDPAIPLARLRIRVDFGWVLDQYPMQRVAVLPDGSVEATMRFATLDWMARLLLGFGAAVTVLGPPELITAVRDRSTAALDAYGALADSGAEGYERAANEGVGSA